VTQRSTPRGSPPRSAPGGASAGKVDILVVDDRPENLLAMQGMLSRPDYNVVAAASGGEALKAVLRHDFAVVLLDVMMPDLDGFETARLLRERDASRDLPIIFLTATGAATRLAGRGYALGAVDYLVKPVDPDVVRAKVSVFVDLHRKAQRVVEQEATLRELERRRIDAERKDAADRQRFLSRASELLLESFDYGKTLGEVAHLAVPALADGCVVELAADGGLEDVAVAHVDPEKEEVLRELRGRLRALRAGDGVEVALRTRRAVRLSDAFSPRPLAQTPQASAATELARRMGSCASLVVPLVAREHVLGAITFLFASDRGGGTARTDLPTAEDLAHRVAFAVDNARLYKEAQDAVSARDEFLSIASHELRTPLTPLQILLQRLVRERRPGSVESAPPERVRSALERAERQVQRIGALVDSLLDVSRIRAGALELRCEPCDLADVTREVVRRLADEIARAGSALEVRADPGVAGSWDRLRLGQLVANLVTNALKYGEGKPIQITVDRLGEVARFRIQDRGIGIDPAKASRVFDRFERAVSSRSYGGLGLGLYLARQIADAHGGRIRLASQPGAGSLFTVELPLWPAAAAAIEGGQRREEGRHGGASHPH
jgi:signal transduction histidine kinase/DNA-binding response OmpR family regulator